MIAGLFLLAQTAQAESKTLTATITDTDTEDTTTVTWQVATDSSFSSIAASGTDSAVTMSGGTGSFSVDVVLTPTVTTTYYWRIKAKDHHNAESGWSATDTFTITIVAPTCTESGSYDPEATITAGDGQNVLTFTWKPNIDTLKVYSSTSGADFEMNDSTLLTSITGSGSYTHSNLTNGTKYYYKIAIVSVECDLTLVNTLNATPTGTERPTCTAATTNDTLTATSSDRKNYIKITGLDSNYKLYYSATTGSFSPDDNSNYLATLQSGETYTHTGLTNNNKYYYKVLFSDSCGNLVTLAANATPQGNIITSTLDVQTTCSQNNAQATFTWETNVATLGVINYWQDGGKVNQSGGSNVQARSQSHTRTISGLSAGTRYNFELSSTDAAGNTGESSGVFTTPSCESVVGKITLAATAGDKNIALDWTTSGKSFSNYKIYRSRESNVSQLDPNLIAQISNASLIRYIDTKVENNLTYYYVIVGTTTDSEEVVSNEVFAKPVFIFKPDPACPTTSKKIKVTTEVNSVVLNFDPAIAGLVTHIYRSTSEKSWGEKLVETYQGRFKDSRVNYNTVYYYTFVDKILSNDQACPPTTTSAFLSQPNLLQRLFNPPPMVASIIRGTNALMAAIITALVALTSLLPALINFLINRLPILGSQGLGALGSGASFITNLGNLLARFAFWKRRRKNNPWGRVLESSTGMPIAGAVVQVFSTEVERPADRTVTDKTGLYTFLISKPGTYRITANASGYQAYRSIAFTINDTTRLPQEMDISLEGMALQVPNWLYKLLDFMRPINRLMDIIRMPLLIGGTLLTLYNIIVFKDIVSYAFGGLYIIFWAFEIWSLRSSRPYGRVSDRLSGAPVAHAIVRVNQVVSGQPRLKTTVLTDDAGNFRTLVPPGQYILSVTAPSYKPNKSETISLYKAGIVNLNLDLEKVVN